MSISKKIRFDIFKRDGFKCCYCGKAPPAVILEVDHIQPKSKKGTDDINNLITACFDCNRGKAAIPLDKIPNTISQNMQVLIEQQEQLKEYNKFLAKLQRKKMIDAEEIERVFNSFFPEYVLDISFIKGTIFTLLDKLPKEIIKEAMIKSCAKFVNRKSPYNAIKYFCGICWNIIKKR